MWATRQITTLALLTDVYTPPGTWDIWYADMSIISADGTVTSIIGSQPPTPTYGDFQGTGWTGTPTAIAESVPRSADPTVASGGQNAASTHYYLGDHLGTAQMEFASGGWPVWQGQFAPYGQELRNGQPLDPTAADGSSNHYKFTGKERDSESGLDYFGARYYASSMGRWMSPDWADKPEAVPYSSLGNPQSLNLYGYVGNNPLIRFDPDGHDMDSDWVKEHGIESGDVFNKVQQAQKSVAQQQSATTTSNSSTSADPITTALSNVSGVASVTPAPDPTLDVPKGGHQNETDALTFKTPQDQAAFLGKSGRKHLVSGDVSENGYGPGVRLPGGLHAEHGHVDPRTGQFLVTSHIDRFNPNNGLAPLVGHFVVDVIYGSIRYPNSAGLDH